MYEEALLYALAIEREALRAVEQRIRSQQLGEAWDGLLQNQERQSEAEE